MIKSYRFEDSKYIVSRNCLTYEIKIYRHGERWEIMENEMRHCKMFHAMLNYIDDLEEQVGTN